jgi:hypothetical protein
LILVFLSACLCPSIKNVMTKTIPAFCLRCIVTELSCEGLDNGGMWIIDNVVITVIAEECLREKLDIPRAIGRCPLSVDPIEWTLIRRRLPERLRESRPSAVRQMGTNSSFRWAPILRFVPSEGCRGQCPGWLVE